jgi:starvation-inducible outer membrane lipoprotein
MRYFKHARIFALVAFVAFTASACATCPPTADAATGPSFRAASADPTPAPTSRASGLIVLMDATVTNTTPAVSPYAFVGHQSTLGMQLVTTGNLQGDWKIEVSCSPTAVATANLDPNTRDVTPTLAAVNDDPSDITSAFTPSIASVTTASSQYVQASPLNAGYVRATFTATSGSGHARVNLRN